MLLFNYSVSPSMTLRISKNSTIVDHLMVCTSVVYFLIYILFPPQFALLYSISFLIVTEILGSISQSLVSLSEQVRISSIIGPSLVSQIDRRVGESENIKLVFDAEVPFGEIENSKHMINQISQVNIVQAERGVDILGLASVVFLPSILGFGVRYFLSL